MEAYYYGIYNLFWLKILKTISYILHIIPQHPFSWLHSGPGIAAHTAGLRGNLTTAHCWALSPHPPPPQHNRSAVSGSSTSTHCSLCGVHTHLTAWRGGQDVIGVHGAQLVPAAVPPRLTFDADDLVNAFQAVHTHRVQVHESPCAQKTQCSECPSRNHLLSTKAHLSITSTHFIIWINTKSKIDDIYYIFPSCPFRIMMNCNFCQQNMYFRFNLIKHLLGFAFPKSATRFTIQTSKLKWPRHRCSKPAPKHTGLSA